MSDSVLSDSMRDELSRLDATASADLVRRREVSPLELTEAAITRIERLDPALHAVVRTRFEDARMDAGGTLAAGPLRGVPFLLKDLGAFVAGQRTDFGSGVLHRSDVRWPVTSYVADAFSAAGLVDLGRSATPEFGTTITTEPTATGPTRNPWDTERSAGGSSGGAAAAVAAGMVPVAHASDGGGSIRIPASCCGLVGLKPSRGRVSHGPMVGESWAGSTTDGALARTVRDAAAMLDVLRRPRPGDPYYAPPVARPYRDEVGLPPGRLRIGLLTGPGRRGAPPPHPEVVVGAENAGRLLADLGHDVELASPAAMHEEDYARHFLTVVTADVALLVQQLERVLARPIDDAELEPRNATYRRAGATLSATDYLAARGWLGQWARRVATFWAAPDQGGQGFDLLVLPVIATVPPEIGWYTAGGPQEEDARIASVLQYTGQFNATGQPAISVPLHWTEQAVPVGVQLVGAYGREDLLLRVAAQLEEVQPWSGRLPAVHASR
jgi:amidase